MYESTSEPGRSHYGGTKQISVGESEKWFSDKLTLIFQWATFSTLGQAVALFGVGSNIINIICFVKQGFKDPVNVSFLACAFSECCIFICFVLHVNVGLAIADLGCLVTMLWTNLCLNPSFISVDLPFDPIETQHIMSATPHFFFNRISSWITALITLERCLCIIAPIKVKTIVTTKRVLVTIICVFIILITTAAPIYSVKGLGQKFFPRRNKTLIGMVIMGDRLRVETVLYIINNACIPFLAFVVVTICTTVLVIQLRKKSKWRKASTVSTQADNVSTRNEKVAKMVVTISVLFIFCFTPVCLIFIARALVPSISMDGKQKNVVLIFGGFATLLESVNSSANIFIYYDMSSKYRTVLRQLFRLSGSK